MMSNSETTEGLNSYVKIILMIVRISSAGYTFKGTRYYFIYIPNNTNNAAIQ